jgi:hypothetical protein
MWRHSFNKKGERPKMDIEKKRFRKMFPNLAQELDNGNCGTKINSCCSDTPNGEQVVSKKFVNYSPDVIDFLRRCDKAEQAEEIIDYMEKMKEISCEYATKLREQLNKKGVRSFGSKKEDDYYLKQDKFYAKKIKKKKQGFPN